MLSRWSLNRSAAVLYVGIGSPCNSAYGIGDLRNCVLLDVMLDVGGLTIPLSCSLRSLLLRPDIRVYDAMAHIVN